MLTSQLDTQACGMWSFGGLQFGIVIRPITYEPGGDGSCLHREVQPLYLLGQGRRWPQGRCGYCVLREVCIRGGLARGNPLTGKCVPLDLDTQVAIQRTCTLGAHNTVLGLN